MLKSSDRSVIFFQMEFKQEEAVVDIEVSGMPVSTGETTGIARVVRSLAEAHSIQVSGF